MDHSDIVPQLYEAGVTCERGRSQKTLRIHTISHQQHIIYKHLLQFPAYYFLKHIFFLIN